MKRNVLGNDIPRADERTIKALLDLGLIYIGEDNEMHVREQKNIPTQPTKVE